MLVGTRFEPAPHVSAVPALRIFVRRPAGVGGDDRAHAQFVPGQFVIRFGVVPGVGNDAFDPAPAARLTQKPGKELLVTAGSGRRLGGQDQVAVGVDRQRQLGQPFDHPPAIGVGLFFPLFRRIFLSRPAPSDGSAFRSAATHAGFRTSSNPSPPA